MQPPLKLSQALWISDPAALLHIDFDDPVSIENNTSMTSADLDMSTMGWRRVGAVTLEYVIDKSREQMAQAAVDAAVQALQKLDADHQVQVGIIQATISKLQTLTWNGQTVQEMQDTSVVSDAVYSSKEPAPDWLDLIQVQQWKCVKTGCQLNLTGTGTAVISYWGDLFFDLDTQEYLFNCANDDPSQSRCSNESSFCISADVEDDNFVTSYAGFPRLFLFPAETAGLSEELEAYIKGTSQ